MSRKSYRTDLFRNIGRREEQQEASERRFQGKDELKVITEMYDRIEDAAKEAAKK